MPRDLLRRTHRWLGLLIALPIALQGLSGAVLALAELVPEQRGTMAPPRPAGSIVAAAEQWTGDTGRATRYVAPSGVGYAARVEVAVPGERPRTLRIDPATLTVLLDTPPAGDALAWVRTLHVQFLTEGGRAITGWFGIALLIMLLTAVPLWWPIGARWRPAFTADLGARGWAFHRRLHGAAGAWFGGVLLLLTVTGIVMAFPRTARGILGLEQRQPRPAPAADAAPLSPAALDHAIDLGRLAVPELRFDIAFLPSRPGEPMRLVFHRPGDTSTAGAVMVQVDAQGGQVRAVDQPAVRLPAEQFYRWLHDLHTGSGIGAWWRIGASAAGLTLALLSLTGSMMWWRRRRARRRVTLARAVDIRASAATSE